MKITVAVDSNFERNASHENFLEEHVQVNSLRGMVMCIERLWLQMPWKRHAIGHDRVWKPMSGRAGAVRKPSSNIATVGEMSPVFERPRLQSCCQQQLMFRTRGPLVSPL